MEVVRARGVGKEYRRAGHDRPQTLKEAALRGFKSLRRDRFWALSDVSFTVESGRTMGVIGGNGAGKSTLLRLLAGVERPDKGTLEVQGRVGALLELGGSFHMELTGLENIMLASVVAGLTRKEARARIDDIVAFAQLEEFISSPLRMYSTGMVMRLAFSIASHVDPEVLIVDEALSVGDLSFQQRCLDKMREFRQRGVTLVLVSHDPSRIRDFCDEVIWLRAGKVAAQGPPMEVTARYVQSQAEATRQSTPSTGPEAFTPGGVRLEVHRNRFGSLEGTIDAMRIRNFWGEECSTFESGSAVRVEIDVTLPPDKNEAFVYATIRRADEIICLDTNTNISVQDGRGRVLLDIERLDLAAGEYVFDVGVYGTEWGTYDYHYGAYPFSVTGSPAGAGVLAPPTLWRVEARAVAG
jgi:homopolymeric O-antigen transport system ATP-binding protein